MKAMIYKKYIDQRLSLVLSSLLLAIMLYIDIRNYPIIFFWLTTSGIRKSKEELAYFRTMNFSKSEYFFSTIIFSMFKFILRTLLLILVALLFSKSFPILIRFIFINYLITVLEITIELSTYNLRGNNNKGHSSEITVIVLFVFVFLIGLVLLVQNFYWPMERFVYGSLYITLSSFILGVYNFYNYKGVDYAKNKRLKI